MQDIIDSFYFVERFDRYAGHQMQHDKTTFAATDKADSDRLRALRLGPDAIPPTVTHQAVLVGDVIATQLKGLSVEPDKRVARALKVVHAVLALGCSVANAAYAIRSAAIPRMIYGTQWALPSAAAMMPLC